MFREVPWRDWKEWRQCRDDLFGLDWLNDDVKIIGIDDEIARINKRRRGIDTIMMWINRSPLLVPSPVECTSMVIEVSLFQGNEHQMRLAYSTAVIRSVNLIVDPILKVETEFKSSVLNRAKKLDLPLWLVAIRHSATHENLPSLNLLKSACKQLINYLVRVYWIPQEELIKEQETRIYKTIPEAVNKVLSGFQGSLVNPKFKSSNTSDLCKKYADSLTNDLDSLLPQGFSRSDAGFNSFIDSIIFHFSMVITATPIYEKEYFELFDIIGTNFPIYYNIINRWIQNYVIQDVKLKEQTPMLLPWLDKIISQYIKMTSKLKNKSVAKGSIIHRQIREWILLCMKNFSDISFATIEKLQVSIQNIDKVFGDITLLKGLAIELDKSFLEEKKSGGLEINIDDIENECQKCESKIFGDNYKDPYAIDSSSPWCTTQNCEYTLIE